MYLTIELPIYIKKTLTEMKGLNNSTVIIGDFNTHVQ